MQVIVRYIFIVSRMEIKYIELENCLFVSLSAYFEQ